MPKRAPSTLAYYSLTQEERMWLFRFSSGRLAKAAKTIGIGTFTARNLLDPSSRFTKGLIEHVRLRIQELQQEDDNQTVQVCKDL